MQVDRGSVLPGAALTGCVALNKSLCLSESPFPRGMHRKGDCKGLCRGSNGLEIMLVRRRAGA